MDRAVLEKLISEDDQGLLTIDRKSNWRIYGRLNGKRGGAFYGWDENNIPVFGGGKLIHAPIWWNKSFSEVQEVCNKIIADYPECEAMPYDCIN